MRKPFILLLCVVPALLTSSCTSPVPEQDAGIPVNMQLLGKNRWASQQRSPAGRGIQTVEYHQGEVYVGFGDWRVNTGPIAVTAWDIRLQDWTVHFTAGTEAIERFRTLGTDIVLPYTDPKRSFDYAQGPSWRESRVTAARQESFNHAFDAAETSAGRFLIGTRFNTGEATVMQQQDNGEWRESLLLKGAIDWFWFAAVLDDELVVQSERQGSYRYHNGAWEQVAPLFGNPRMRSVVSVGGRVAGISRASMNSSDWRDIVRAGYLNVSDGRTSTQESTATALDLNLDQATGWVYLLRSDRIERSRDLLEWETLTLPVPAAAIAIDAAGDHVWIGTEDSSLWELRL